MARQMMNGQTDKFLKSQAKILFIILLQVIDKLSTEPLIGVLVSVSGEDMRNSNKTNEDGILVHIDIVSLNVYM